MRTLKSSLQKLLQSRPTDSRNSPSDKAWTFSIDHLLRLMHTPVFSSKWSRRPCTALKKSSNTWTPTEDSHKKMCAAATSANVLAQNSVHPAAEIWRHWPTAASAKCSYQPSGLASIQTGGRTAQWNFPTLLADIKPVCNSRSTIDGNRRCWWPVRKTPIESWASTSSRSQKVPTWTRPRKCCCITNCQVSLPKSGRSPVWTSGKYRPLLSNQRAPFTYVIPILTRRKLRWTIDWSRKTHGKENFGPWTTFRRT